MTHHPLTTTERAAKRKAIRAHWVAEAERKALYMERSLKCSGFNGIAPPNHAGDPDGCKNDGTGCICECHDPEPARLTRRNP